MDLGDVGVICLNAEIKGVCENCLWWEWDSSKQQCSNWQYPVCPIYWQKLFDKVP